VKYPVLKAEERHEKGKGPMSKLRRDGYLPAVVYGKDFENTMITVKEKEFSKILKTKGVSALISLQLGKDSHPVMMKEIQRDTLKDSISHVDFYKVSMDEEVEYTLPIVLLGEPEGVKSEGGVMQQQKRELIVKALPLDMLDNVEIDISSLKIGDTLTVADLDIDKKNTVVDEPEEVIVSILAPTMEEEEETEVSEDDLEPELVGDSEEKTEEE